MDTATATAGRPHVLFGLAGGTYALSSDVILHLALPGEVTPVPHAPPWVEGVSSIRGRVTPVMDLRARFGFPSVPTDAKTRLLVVAVGDRAIALRVDSAREFALLPEDSIAPLEGATATLGAGYVRGTIHLGERVVMVIDPDSLVQ